MVDKRFWLVAGAIFVLSVSISQAKAQTADQVEKILEILDAENCEIIRDAMGEKMLSAEDDTFVVDAACTDGKSYTIIFDQSFQIIEQRPHEN